MEYETNSSPLVSVLMPVYNAAPYVQESINSILNQTFTDFKLFIFNDGSTDNSAEIINAIADERIVFIDSVQNLGYVAHLNEGLQMVRSKYVARMDADDIALPTRFEQQVSLLENNPEIGLCGTAYSTFGAQTRTVAVPVNDVDIREFLLSNSPLGHPTVMFRKALIEKYKLSYNHAFMPAEDYKLWYDFSKIAKLHNIPDVLLQYRVHPHQISSYMNSTQRSNADKVRLLQLIDKGFELTSHEQLLYCHVLQYTPLPQTVDELEAWRLVMLKIKAENKRLRAYDEIWFDRLFAPAWLIAINGIKKYSLRYLWPALLRPRPTATTLSVATTLRVAAKSLLYWKAKPELL